MHPNAYMLNVSSYTIFEKIYHLSTKLKINNYSEVVSEQYGVALIMPAYNEEEHLKDTISSIPEIVDLILFINDGSTDSTLEGK